MLYFIDFIVLVEQNLEFDNILFTNEINKIKENMKKIKEKEAEIEKLNNKN